MDDLGVGLTVGAFVVAVLIGADLMRAGRCILARRFRRLRRTTINVYSPACVWLPAGATVRGDGVHVVLTREVYIDAGEEVTCEVERL